MASKSPVFDQTYDHYLERIGRLDLALISEKLGAVYADGKSTLSLLGEPFGVAHTGISGPDGKKPALDRCVILSQYYLRCPATEPDAGQWAAYRDFKDSGPLTVYFANEVEGRIVKHFAGNLAALTNAVDALGGQAADIDANYDLAAAFDALPKIKLLLLFNDAEGQFGASCRVLFEQRAQHYLDGESLAMLGGVLGHRLIKA